jgi:hypothetical protein
MAQYRTKIWWEVKKRRLAETKNYLHEVEYALIYLIGH